MSNKRSLNRMINKKSNFVRKKMKTKTKYILYTLLLLLSLNPLLVNAQTAKKIAKNITKSFKIEGTWDYEGASVVFKSDNLLKKAGGKVIANQTEKNINELLTKIGFEAGKTTFVFNDDGTFKNITNERTLPGKYTYNSSSKELNLKYVNHISIKMNVSGSGSKMSLLFGADEFLSMVTFIGGNSGITIIQSLTSILNSYDGMMIGMQLRKQ